MHLIPIGDENEPGAGLAPITILILALNVIVFIVQQTSEAFTCANSLVPYEITHGTDLVQPVPVTVQGQRFEIPECPGPNPIYLTFLTSMFMHANLLHIGGNMLFLWIFGDNVERAFGWLRYVAFYLAAGIAASLTQIALGPDSVIPNLGASGAIAGVLGAYLVLFPGNRVRVLTRVGIVPVPAVFMIGFWALTQFISLGIPAEGGGVAYGAHVGGFIAGVLLAFLMRGRGAGPRRAYAAP